MCRRGIRALGSQKSVFPIPVSHFFTEHIRYRHDHILNFSFINHWELFQLWNAKSKHPFLNNYLILPILILNYFLHTCSLIGGSNPLLPYFLPFSFPFCSSLESLVSNTKRSRLYLQIPHPVVLPWYSHKAPAPDPSNCLPHPCPFQCCSAVLEEVSPEDWCH